MLRSQGNKLMPFSCDRGEQFVSFNLRQCMVEKANRIPLLIPLAMLFISRVVSVDILLQYYCK